jgi:type I restriction enzyme S subunit
VAPDLPFTVLAIKNLNGDYVTNVHRCSPKIEKPYVRSRVRPGDVLVSVKGTIGRIGLVPQHFTGNISRDLARISLMDSDVPEFWYQMLQSDMAQGRLGATTVGTTRLELSIGPLKQVKMPRPPKLEQRAIAEALSDVDALLDGLDQLIAKKRDLKQASMRQLLTGQTRLPGFSDEWEDVRLGDLFKFKNGLNKGKEFFGYGTPIVNYMDVFGSSKMQSAGIEGRVSLTAAERKNFDVRKGDVFFTRTSETVEEIGVAAVMLDEPTDTVFSGFVLRARPLNRDRLCDAFKAYCFGTSVVRKQITSKASYTTRALTNGRIQRYCFICLRPLNKPPSPRRFRTWARNWPA